MAIIFQFTLNVLASGLLPEVQNQRQNRLPATGSGRRRPSSSCHGRRASPKQQPPGDARICTLFVNILANSLSFCCCFAAGYLHLLLCFLLSPFLILYLCFLSLFPVCLFNFVNIFMRSLMFICAISLYMLDYCTEFVYLANKCSAFSFVNRISSKAFEPL